MWKGSPAKRLAPRCYRSRPGKRFLTRRRAPSLRAFVHRKAQAARRRPRFCCFGRGERRSTPVASCKYSSFPRFFVCAYSASVAELAQLLKAAHAHPFSGPRYDGVMRLVAAIILLSAGCSSSELRFEPRSVESAFSQGTEFTLFGLNPSSYLRARGGRLKAVDDLAAHIGTVSLPIDRIGAKGIHATLEHRVQPGSYEVRLHADGRDWVAATALRVTDGGLDGGAAFDGGGASTDAGPGDSGQRDSGAPDASMDAGRDAGRADAGDPGCTSSCGDGVCCTEAGENPLTCGTDCSCAECGSGCTAPTGCCERTCTGTCSPTCSCASCFIACAASEDCFTTCSNGGSCTIACISAATCGSTCQAGSSCAIDCTDAATCAATCESLSSCDIECRDALDCDNIACRSGAGCLVRCIGADTCGFSECVGGQASCPGSVIVCNRACP